MRHDIALPCQSCTECGQVKDRRPSASSPLQTAKAGFSNEMIGVDIIGPLPRTDRGNLSLNLTTPSTRGDSAEFTSLDWTSRNTSSLHKLVSVTKAKRTNLPRFESANAR
ncbi:hypothetical protein CSKR_100598 [Clonorchis sinensis]|uniref:Uncharacterized protein n=1 Tax=Clonorchis sinensis TaxID=79923 RepID=A0A3R7D5G5_CLOSI|nr:hypothetical protein CSKR_100598 [Clonorchis sinensis]